MYNNSRFKKTTNQYYVDVVSNLCIKFNASELRCLNSHAFQTFYLSAPDRQNVWTNLIPRTVSYVALPMNLISCINFVCVILD